MYESDTNMNVKFPLKVTENKAKTKALFAEVDSSFADMLLSFLTLPLGTIVRIFQKHYKHKAPPFGSLSTLYKSLLNLHSSKFRTEGARSILLNPRSSYGGKKSKPETADFFDTYDYNYDYDYDDDDYDDEDYGYDDHYDYDDDDDYDYGYDSPYNYDQRNNGEQNCDGGFTNSKYSFLITENLQIVPNTGLQQIAKVLGPIDMDDVALSSYTIGFAQIIDLLKASLISPTPLSVIKPSMNSVANAEGETSGISYPNTLLEKYAMGSGESSNGNASTFTNSKNMKHGEASTSNNSEKMNLKLIVQKSRNKLVCAEAEEDFVELLFGLLIIPLGQVESLLKNNSGIKAIDNLYKSVGEFMGEKYFKSGEAKEMVMMPKIPYTEALDSSSFLLLGKGNYLVGPQIYKVEDDLTVTPFCFTSVFSSLKKLGIPMSDVEEVHMQIGLDEALRILKASLTSTSALTDALLPGHVANKEPKQEPSTRAFANKRPKQEPLTRAFANKKPKQEPTIMID